MTNERTASIDRILELLASYWHANPSDHLDEIALFLFTEGHCTTEAEVEERLRDAIAKLDYKVLPPRHPSPCVAHANGTCVWLRDGTKVTLKRDANTTGIAWLEVEEQSTVRLAEGVSEPQHTVAEWPELSTAEKSEAVLKRVLEHVNETEGARVSFEADWQGNSITVFLDDAHSHCGDPGGTWEELVDDLHRLLCHGRGLSFSRPNPSEPPSSGGDK